MTLLNALNTIIRVLLCLFGIAALSLFVILTFTVLKGVIERLIEDSKHDD